MTTMYQIYIKEPINLTAYATIFLPNTTKSNAEKVAVETVKLLEKVFGYEDLYWTLQIKKLGE